MFQLAVFLMHLRQIRIRKTEYEIKTYIEAITKNNNAASKILNVNETEEIESYLFDAEILVHMKKLHNALEPLRCIATDIMTCIIAQKLQVN